MKDTVLSIIAVIVLLTAFIAGLFYGTSAKVWYAGMHDSQHEGHNCKCYERLVAEEQGEIR